MPIDFDCAKCGQRLRVGDDAVGRSVRCTACQQVQPVPATLTEADYELLPDLDELPAGPPRTMNPYAAPMASDFSAMAQFGPGEPDGPAWERDRYTLEAFFATLRELTFSPRRFFSGMRRYGGHLGPMRFTALSAIIGIAALAAYGMIYTHVLRPVPGRLGPNEVGSLIAGFCCCAGILGPLACIAHVFAAAGVFHTALVMCDSADLGWEATFRVVTYSFGTMLMFCIIPIVGPYLTLIAYLIYATVGLSVTHQAAAWKAAIAVWLPSVLAITAFVLLIVAIATHR